MNLGISSAFTEDSPQPWARRCPASSLWLQQEDPMKRTLATCTLAVMLCGYAESMQPLQASARGASSLVVPTTRCSDLLALTLPDTQITSATPVAANGAVPAHCRVVGVTHGEPGSNVTVEVRMPDTWNEKLVMTTRQGYMGSLPPVTNLVVSTGLLRHYTLVTTDGGHTGASILDASFGLNNRPAEIDYGYRAPHLARLFAAALTNAYYSSDIVHAYYNGCSASGRYAVQVAEHYPGDFDGIIAGSPALDMLGTVLDETWIEQAMAAAPLPTAKLPVVFNAVLAACDGADGLVDGLIDDPHDCHFDVQTLVCADGDGPDCLTGPQVATLQKIYTGAVDSAGNRLSLGFAYGGELPDPIAADGWDVYVTRDAPPPLDVTLQDQYLRYLAFDVDDPTFDWHTFNFDLDPPRMANMHAIFDPVQNDLTPFAEAGGKMIIYQGWGDIAVSPYRTLQYYLGLRQHRGRRAVEDYARLFMAPGMYHCNGGVGPNTFDALTALEQWVEQGQPPASILATQASGPGAPRSRPLCPFPQHAVYTGAGSIADAANFVCRGAPLGTGK
jgi:feruloyl esterase